MPLAFGLRAIEKANDEVLTEKAWELYLVLLPNWDSKSRMSFADFLSKTKRNDADADTTTITKTDMERYADVVNLKRNKA